MPAGGTVGVAIGGATGGSSHGVGKSPNAARSVGSIYNDGTDKLPKKPAVEAIEIKPLEGIREKLLPE